MVCSLLRLSTRHARTHVHTHAPITRYSLCSLSHPPFRCKATVSFPRNDSKIPPWSTWSMSHAEIDETTWSITWNDHEDEWLGNAKITRNPTVIRENVVMRLGTYRTVKDHARDSWMQKGLIKVTWPILTYSHEQNVSCSISVHRHGQSIQTLNVNNVNQRPTLEKLDLVIYR